MSTDRARFVIHAVGLALLICAGCAPPPETGRRDVSNAAAHEQAASTAAEAARAPKVSTTADDTVRRCQEILEPVIDGIWVEPGRLGTGVYRQPLKLVEQEYELGSGDEPYVRGAPLERTLADLSTVRDVLVGLSQRVGERSEAVPAARPADDEVAIGLLGDSAATSDAIYCELTLEVGDVEHILVVEAERLSSMIRAMYVN